MHAATTPLKEVPKDITLPKAVQPVLGKRRAVRNFVIEVERVSLRSDRRP
jgi:hypothetical protein